MCPRSGRCWKLSSPEYWYLLRTESRVPRPEYLAQSTSTSCHGRWSAGSHCKAIASANWTLPLALWTTSACRSLPVSRLPLSRPPDTLDPWAGIRSKRPELKCAAPCPSPPQRCHSFLHWAVLIVAFCFSSCLAAQTIPFTRFTRESSRVHTQSPPASDALAETLALRARGTCAHSRIERNSAHSCQS